MPEPEISKPKDNSPRKYGSFDQGEVHKPLRIDRRSLLTSNRAREVLLLRLRGASWSFIARQFRVSSRTVRSWVARYPELFSELTKGDETAPAVSLSYEFVTALPGEDSFSLPPGVERKAVDPGEIDEARRSAVARLNRSSAYGALPKDVIGTRTVRSDPGVLAQTLGVSQGIAQSILRQSREAAYQQRLAEWRGHRLGRREIFDEFNRNQMPQR